MAGSFPGSVTTYTNPGPTQTTLEEIGGRSHDEFHADNNDDLEQIMSKLGTGASVPTTVGHHLRVTASGETAYGAIAAADIATGLITSVMISDGTIVNGDINANAAIAHSKLATATPGHVIREVSGGTIGSGFVVDGNIAAAANVAISKLAHIGAGNVIRSNGSTNVAGQVQTGDIAPNAVGQRRLAYTLGTDVWSASPLGASANADLFADQSFTVDNTGSVIGVSAYGSIQASSATVAAPAQLRVMVDGTPTPIGGGILAVAGGLFIILGAKTLWLTGLAAGSHTVRLNVLAGGAALSLYLRASTVPFIEFAGVSVVEIKR